MINENITPIYEINDDFKYNILFNIYENDLLINSYDLDTFSIDKEGCYKVELVAIDIFGNVNNTFKVINIYDSEDEINEDINKNEEKGCKSSSSSLIFIPLITLITLLRRKKYEQVN